MDEARRAAEIAARSSYGRLVARLSSRSRDIAAAEDALGEAFRIALETWPARGVPQSPEAWLLTVARREIGRRVRHDRVRDAAGDTLQALHDELGKRDNDGFPDERLKLLFVCAHPAIDETVRTPLMLQVVLGLDAGRIANAFLVSPAAMGQRLSRAKAKIRDAGVPFAEPEPHELERRLGAVLAAIYAAYGTGWEDAIGADPKRRGLAAEAIFLGRLAVDLAPTAAEARGLLALMLHCEARRGARRDSGGAFVPLREQDPALWSTAMIAEAEAQLLRASSSGAPGRFQLEAAIQSVHAARAGIGRTNWRAVVALYGALAALAPTIGVMVARAAALGEAEGAASGLAALAALPTDVVAAYQPYWAARAHLLSAAGRKDEAATDYARAIGLTEDGAVRAFLLSRREGLRTG